MVDIIGVCRSIGISPRQNIQPSKMRSSRQKLYFGKWYDCSIRPRNLLDEEILGNHYRSRPICEAPRLQVTLVSIVAEDGFEWVGKPQDMPADRLNGHTLISHNAEFDSVCAEGGHNQGTDAPVHACGLDMHGRHGIVSPATPTTLLGI